METYQSGRYRVEREGEYRYVIPRQGGMRTRGIILASSRIFEAVLKDGCVTQVANVAHLPGIVGDALAMPDIHSGYGFPIGGVAAFDADDGVVSPGGVGYDINCGVRLLASRLERDEIRDLLSDDLLDALFSAVPAGVGSKRKDLGISRDLMESCLVDGAAAAVEAGFGDPADLERIESQGRLEGAEPGEVSSRAWQRGIVQLGTLGSGNHFVEVGFVERVLDQERASAFGLEAGQVTVMIHTGSRGFGHQVCEDAVSRLRNATWLKSLDLPDRQLCCAPIQSKMGRSYLAGMAAAANFAFANRQFITQKVREAFNRKVRGGGRDTTLDLVYDLTHNIAKFETHTIEGKGRRVLVHRKGATRSFPAGHAELTLPEFREHGHPVLVPGDMGRCSYVLAGLAQGEALSFCTSAHGAGRAMSRGKAKASTTAGKVLKELKRARVLVRSVSKSTIVEECPQAYKNVEDVVAVLERTGMARPVARLRPLLVVKG